MIEDVLLYGRGFIISNGEVASWVWAIATTLCILAWLFEKWCRHNGLE